MSAVLPSPASLLVTDVRSSTSFVSMETQAQLALNLRSQASEDSGFGSIFVSDTVSVPVLTQFKRMTSYYQIPISPVLQTEMIRGLHRLRERIARKNTHFEKGRGASRWRLAAAQDVFPEGPRWIQDLLIHLYLERKTSPDEFGFVLRTARLMQGVSNVDVGQKGFNEHMIKYVEKGSLLKRGSFREASALYGVPYQPLAFSYLRRHFSSVPWKRLAYFKGPIFADAAEKPKLQAYARRPGTLGEMIFFARAERDWTQVQLVQAVQAHVDRLVPAGHLRRIPPKTSFNKQDLEHIEANRSYLPLAKCLALAQALGIPWDDFVKTLSCSYMPALVRKNPRLGHEPIFILPGESSEERKIRAYAASPGTSGEAIFWARKRKLWTLEDLAEISGVRSDLIYRYELNQRTPNEVNWASLAGALGLIAIEA